MTAKWHYQGGTGRAMCGIRTERVVDNPAEVSCRACAAALGVEPASARIVHRMKTRTEEELKAAVEIPWNDWVERKEEV